MFTAFICLFLVFVYQNQNLRNSVQFLVTFPCVSSPNFIVIYKIMSTSYRNSGQAHAQNSSDDGEISDSDSDAADALWSKKRTRSNLPQDSVQTRVNVLPQAKSKRSKNANIWGSVLTEQSSDDISSTLGAVGMQYQISRGPESFALPSNLVGGKVQYSSSSDSSDHDSNEKTQQQAANDSKDRTRKRKMTKNRNNVPVFKPGQEVTLNKRIELSDTDPVDKVSEEIAFRLWERKKNLIRAITETIGVPTAINFYNKTEDIEKGGGLMTMSGARRRTPGGTFLHLIRNDHELDQEPINKIFSLEAEREKMLWELKKHSRKTEKEEKNTVCEMDDLSVPQKSKPTNAHFCENGRTDPPIATIAKKKQNPADLSDGEIMDSDDEQETFG